MFDLPFLQSGTSFCAFSWRSLGLQFHIYNRITESFSPFLFLHWALNLEELELSPSGSLAGVLKDWLPIALSSVVFSESTITGPNICHSQMVTASMYYDVFIKLAAEH